MTVVDAVARVPAAVAVMDAVVKGVTDSGIPTSCTVSVVTFDSDNPVPTKAGALNVTAFPDAAMARNWILDV